MAWLPLLRSQEGGHPLHQNARALIRSGMSSRLHLSKAIRARMKRKMKTSFTDSFHRSDWRWVPVER